MSKAMYCHSSYTMDIYDVVCDGGGQMPRAIRLLSLYVAFRYAFVHVCSSPLTAHLVPADEVYPIVHNYTIRLLNRLMRPPLPARITRSFTEAQVFPHERDLLSSYSFVTYLYDYLLIFFFHININVKNNFSL